jgi:PIN domain nuclease of toxin-antitoxin system
VNLLLDTHIALWAVTGDSKLRPDIVQIIANPKNTSFISAASIWEIAIKFARNKGLPDDMPVSGTQARDIFRNAGYQFLKIDADHAAAVDGLPLLHGDPFDRIIVAQARAEGLRLITKDADVAAYDPAIMLM